MMSFNLVLTHKHRLPSTASERTEARLVEYDRIDVKMRCVLPDKTLIVRNSFLLFRVQMAIYSPPDLDWIPTSQSR